MISVLHAGSPNSGTITKCFSLWSQLPASHLAHLRYVCLQLWKLSPHLNFISSDKDCLFNNPESAQTLSKSNANYRSCSPNCNCIKKNTMTLFHINVVRGNSGKHIYPSQLHAIHCVYYMPSCLESLSEYPIFPF